MRSQIPTLDGWRAIAIMMVVAYHLLFSHLSRDSFAFRVAGLGSKGVDIFFALSGFLITTLLLQEREQAQTIGLMSFYTRRMFRILPPYFFYLAVMAIASWVSILSISPLEWAGCLFFFRNYLPEPEVRGWYTAHFWSLSVEEHFYICWPLALILLVRNRLAYPVGLAAIGVAIWRKVDADFQIVQPRGMGRTDVRIDGLLWGAYAAMLFLEPSVQSLLRRLFTIRVWCVGLIALVILLLFEPPFALTCQAVLFPALIIGTIVNSDSWPARMLENGVLKWIGKLSYSLYIWQQFCISGLWYRLGILAPDGPWVIWAGVGLVATFAMASFSYYCIERPAIQLGRRLSGRPRGESEAAGSLERGSSVALSREKPDGADP